MEEKKKTGRPKTEIDEKQVELMASYGMLNTEIASIYGVDPSLITKRFSSVIEKGKSKLKRRLRKAQIDFALKGNATLLIWLGKNILEQTDKTEAEINMNGFSTFVKKLIDENIK